MSQFASAGFLLLRQLSTWPCGNIQLCCIMIEDMSDYFCPADGCTWTTTQLMCERHIGLIPPTVLEGVSQMWQRGDDRMICGEFLALFLRWVTHANEVKVLQPRKGRPRRESCVNQMDLLS